METTPDYMGRNGFIWFHGVVEDINDPLKLGRVRVRCLEFHTDDKTLIPTDSLPWAIVLMPNTSASVSGKGNSPSGLLQGSWVMGFFRDGMAAQDPVILGTFHGLPQPDNLTDKLSNPNYGFNDPLGIYPSEEYKEESDINRLARGDNSSYEYGAIRAKVEKAVTGVKTAMGEDTWSEPITAYASVYPHNKVVETESGHIVEFDDTKNAERIHIRHTSGTWIEIHPDGSIVSKVVGDETNVNIGNSNTLINGDQNTNVNGSKRVRIGKDGLIEVVGDAKILVSGNTVMQTKKDFVHKVEGNYSVAAGGKMLFVASRIDFNPEGVSPSSLSVDLPSSEETVAEKEEYVKKNEEALSYQDVETAAETSTISLGAVSEQIKGKISSFYGQAGENVFGQGLPSTETLPESTTELSTENFVELQSGQLDGVEQPTNFVEMTPAQLHSTGTEVVNTSGTGLQNVQTVETANSPSLMNSLGGIAITAVAVGGVAAAVIGSSSSSTPSAPQTQYPQPLSPVVVPEGSQPVQTNAPGLPTQTFYATPGATATYISGYPGVSGPTLSSTSVGKVSAIPAVPLVGFETEFPTQGIQIVDGGEF